MASTRGVPPLICFCHALQSDEHPQHILVVVVARAHVAPDGTDDRDQVPGLIIWIAIGHSICAEHLLLHYDVPCFGRFDACRQDGEMPMRGIWSTEELQL